VKADIGFEKVGMSLPKIKKPFPCALQYHRKLADRIGESRCALPVSEAERQPDAERHKIRESAPCVSMTCAFAGSFVARTQDGSASYRAS
jgi:hypothetical protein